MTKLFNQENNNLFKLGDNYVCVSDETPLEGDWCLDTYCKIIIKCDKTNYGSNAYDYFKKIIFSTKLIHESIPVLNIESEENIIKLSNEATMDNIFINDEHIKMVAQIFFKKGYLKAKEKYQFTEDDLRRAYEMGLCGSFDESSEQSILDNLISLKESLQQPKQIKSIEVYYDEEPTDDGNAAKYATSLSELQLNSTGLHHCHCKFATLVMLINYLNNIMRLKL